ncbi:transposase [Butyricicoccus faecihominis]|uniref:transposase n=1 Tax=Butyricicoccus faecihominis TaxID=1712515 RepID=UPI0038B3EC2B
MRCGRKWPQRYYRAYDVINSYAKRFLKTVQCLEDGLEDSLAFYAFPMLDARKISSSNMIERLNREIRRRTSVIGIFPNKSSYVRLVTTYLMEYAEDWSASRVNIQRSCFSSYYCSSTAQLCGKPHSVFCTYRIFMRNIDK